MCKFCGDEFESVVHVLWECPVHAAIRNTSIGELDSCGAVLRSLAQTTLHVQLYNCLAHSTHVQYCQWIISVLSHEYPYSSLAGQDGSE